MSKKLLINKVAEKEKAPEKAEEKGRKEAAVRVIRKVAVNFNLLEAGHTYLVVNHYAKTPKKNIAVFHKIFTDRLGNVAALFCVDHNVFAVPEEDLPIMMPIDIDKQQAPMYYRSRIEKHYKKFSEMVSYNPPKDSLIPWIAELL